MISDEDELITDSIHTTFPSDVLSLKKNNQISGLKGGRMSSYINVTVHWPHAAVAECFVTVRKA